MKIAVMGYSGSGKSTLARKLADCCGVPVLFLDTVQFVPGWRERGREEAVAIVRNFMQNNTSWVIDGNYSGFLQKERLEQADLIVLLLFPRLVCLFRALKRYFKNRGGTRESMADGCIEKFDAEFVRWILRDGRSKERRAVYRRVREAYPQKTLVFKNRRQVQKFASRMARQANRETC